MLNINQQDKKIIAVFKQHSCEIKFNLYDHELHFYRMYFGAPCFEFLRCLNSSKSDYYGEWYAVDQKDFSIPKRVKFTNRKSELEALKQLVVPI